MDRETIDLCYSSIHPATSQINLLHAYHGFQWPANGYYRNTRKYRLNSFILSIYYHSRSLGVVCVCSLQIERTKNQIFLF